MNVVDRRIRRNSQNGPDECQLDGMAEERVAESLPQAEGKGNRAGPCRGGWRLLASSACDGRTTRRVTRYYVWRPYG